MKEPQAPLPQQPQPVNPVIVEEAIVALSAEAQRSGNHKNRYFLIGAIILPPDRQKALEQ